MTIQIDENYPDTGYIKLTSKIIDYQISNSRSLLGKGVNTHGNILKFPKILEAEDCNINAVAFSPFGEFDFRIFINKSDPPKWFLDCNIENLCVDGNIILFSTDCFAMIDGEINMYGPDATILGEKFDEVFR